MAESRFKVVFEKLAEASEPAESPGHPQQVCVAHEELDEISELRRLALEIAEPEPRSYTIT